MTGCSHRWSYLKLTHLHTISARVKLQACGGYSDILPHLIPKPLSLYHEGFFGDPDISLQHLQEQPSTDKSYWLVPILSITELRRRHDIEFYIFHAVHYDSIVTV